MRLIGHYSDEYLFTYSLIDVCKIGLFIERVTQIRAKHTWFRSRRIHHNHQLICPTLDQWWRGCHSLNQATPNRTFLFHLIQWNGIWSDNVIMFHTRLLLAQAHNRLSGFVDDWLGSQFELLRPKEAPLHGGAISSKGFIMLVALY